MKTHVMMLSLASAAVLFAAGAAQAQTTQYNSTAANGAGDQSTLSGALGHYNQPIDVAGGTAMCSGIGLTDQDKADAANYPVTLKVVGDYGQWLGDEDFTIRGKGMQQASVHCEGPWLLMKLDPGSYRATVEVPGAAPKTIAFNVPQSGKRDVVVRFPQKMAGRENPERTASLSGANPE